MTRWAGALVRQARALLEPTLPTECGRCGWVVEVGDRWDVGHVADIRVAPDLMAEPSNWRVEHASCNRRAGAKYTNAVAAAKRRAADPRLTSREWVRVF
jgi:hypothetical protein